MVGRDERWTQIAVGTCVLAVVAVAATGMVGGIHVEHLWIAALVATTIAALERSPLSVAPGGRARLYVDVHEVGLGLGLLWLSPAALAVATAGAFAPTLLQSQLPGWKRAFAAAQATLGALAVALVFDAADRQLTVTVVALAALAGWTVMSLPLLLMFDALGENAIGRRVVTTAPLVFGASAAALAVGCAISPLFGGSLQDAALGVVAIAGLIAAMKVGHATAMRADRLRVLLGTTVDLQRTGGVADLDSLLWSLGPEVIPGATGLRHLTDKPGPGTLAAPIGGRGWLVAEYGPGANPPGAEDNHRLQILAEMVGDALEQRERLAEANAEAVTDPMTGLINRRGLDLAMARVGRPAAVAMIDLDRLKVINDTYGHAAGDAALMSLAAALRSVLRASDIAARTGGDEFVVVLPGLSLDEARPILERMSAHLAQSTDVPSGVVVSATVGLAHWNPHDGPSWADVIDSADAQLYARRRADRG
jgi:diguanylate cyclase (GGDEF)-like protein